MKWPPPKSSLYLQKIIILSPALSAVTNTVISAVSLTRETKDPSGCWAATLLTPRPQSDESMGRPETHSLKNGGG